MIRPIYDSLLKIETNYGIADRFLSVECPDEIVATSADRFLTELRAEQVTGPSSRLAKLTLRRENWQLPPDVRRCFTSVEADTSVSFYSREDSFIVALGGSSISATSSAEVHVRLADDLNIQSFLFQRVLTHGFVLALRRVGAFELHCAAVVDPQTSLASLIIGPSGAGKSTLAIQLAGRGWDFSTDDAVLLTQSEELVEAHGLRRDFAVTSETIAHTPLSRLGSNVLNRPSEFDTKYFVRPEGYFPVRHLQKCVPRFLIFSNRNGARQSRAHRLNKAEVMQRLLKMCPWICMDLPIAAAYLKTLDRLARQCLGFELEAGTDLIEDEDYAPKFLRSILYGQAA